nr:MAG TPA: tail assembly chaperone protein [Caudoviricetes sp.]
MFILELQEPLKYGTNEYKKLEFDFEKLRGQDFIDAESEVRKTRPGILFVEADAQFLMELAAKAAGVSSVILADLSAKDFCKIKSVARNFMNVSLGVLPEKSKQY